MKIYINGVLADFPDNTIQYVLNSPVFQEQGGEAALGLQFPMSTRNKEIFHYAHRPEHGRMDTEFQVRIEAGGWQKSGTGILTEAGDCFKMNVGFEKSDFYHRIKDLTLRDLPFSLVSTGGTASLRGHSTDTAKIDGSHKGKEDKVYEVEIPVSGLRLSSLTETGFISVPIGYSVQVSGTLETNSDFHSGRTHIDLEYPNGNGYTVLGRGYLRNRDFTATISRGNVQDRNQYLSCRLMLRITSKSTGGRKHEAKAELVPDEEGITLNVVMGKDIGSGNVELENKPYPEGEYVLAPVYNPSLVGSGGDENTEASAYAGFPLVNYYANGIFPESYSMGGVLRTNMFCPFPYLAHVFDLIARKTGYTIGRNIFKEIPELATLVLYNNFIENKERKDAGSDTSGYEKVPDWDLKNHVSDIGLAEFLKVLNLFGAFLFVDTEQKRLDMIPAAELLSSPIGFSLETQLSGPVTFEPGYDSFEMSFDAGESFAQDMCIDVSKDSLVYYKAETGPAGSLLRYNDLIQYEGSHRAVSYRIYTNADKGEDGTKEDGLVLYGLAQSPFSDKTEDSQNTFQLESPIGPLFSGYAYELEDSGKHRDDPEEDPGGLKSKVTAYSGDSGLLAGSLDAAENIPVLALSFYRGICDGWPTLSHETWGIINKRVQQIPGATIALRWEGENGLYRTFWKPFLDWLTHRARKARIRIPVLPVADLMKIKASCRIRINQQNYIIDTIQADLGDKATNIEIEAYTC